jgi:hypothetical protein
MFQPASYAALHLYGADMVPLLCRAFPSSRRIVRQFVEPATGDYAAHGIFDKRASAFSLQS